MPDSLEGWKEIANGFQERWNFSHTLGAIDGKHKRIRNSEFSGSHYYNYKKFFSVFLLAIVDADYKYLCSWTWELLARSLIGASLLSPSSHSPSTLSTSTGRDSGLFLFPHAAWPFDDNSSSSSASSSSFLLGQTTLDRTRFVPVKQVLVEVEELAPPV